MTLLGPVLDATHAASISSPLLALLAIAGVASAGLTALALVAYRRRRSRSYLLIALALAAVLVRTVVAGGAATNLVPPTVHHLIEHALDVAMAALVVTAVYYARRIEATSEGHP